jgi:hypothetical protein
MNILSEEDFEKLRDSGMLYVVEPECDGSYDSYLKIYGEEPAVEEKKYNLGSIKIRIKDAEHSRCVQEHLFKMGYKWESSRYDQKQEVKHSYADCLYVYENGLILFSDRDERHFNNHQNLEYAFSDEEIGYKPVLPPVDMSRCPPMPTVKPPLGIRPKHIVNMERMQEIIEAMSRYVSERKYIPAEWFDEVRELNEISHC